MVDRDDADFYRFCLKVHGYKFSDKADNDGSELDDDKSESDDDLRSMKPPPIPYDEFKHRVVKLSDLNGNTPVNTNQTNKHNRANQLNDNLIKCTPQTRNNQTPINELIQPKQALPKIEDASEKERQFNLYLNNKQFPTLLKSTRSLERKSKRKKRPSNLPSTNKNATIKPPSQAKIAAPNEDVHQVVWQVNQALYEDEDPRKKSKKQFILIGNNNQVPMNPAIPLNAAMLKQEDIHSKMSQITTYSLTTPNLALPMQNTYNEPHQSYLVVNKYQTSISIPKQEHIREMERPKLTPSYSQILMNSLTVQDACGKGEQSNITSSQTLMNASTKSKIVMPKQPTLRKNERQCNVAPINDEALTISFTIPNQAVSKQDISTKERLFNTAPHRSSTSMKLLIEPNVLGYPTERNLWHSNVVNVPKYYTGLPQLRYMFNFQPTEVSNCDGTNNVLCDEAYTSSILRKEKKIAKAQKSSCTIL